jgi:hypothetical protein
MRNANLLAFLLLACPLVHCSRCVCENVSKLAADQVTISYLVPSVAITLHEPVIWRLQIQNTSSEVIQLDLGKNRNENFIVSYTGPDAETPQTVTLRKPGFGVAGTISISPAETYEQDILLNQWVRFTRAGKYEIEIQLFRPPVPPKDHATVDFRPFKATIEILPPDSKHLEDVCQTLAQKIGDATSYQNAADAALELSFVRDPIAVPFLQKALYAGKLVEPVAIDGLEQVGNQQATRVLVEALNRMPPDITSLVRAALERIENRTSDIRIKDFIQKSLDHR